MEQTRNSLRVMRLILAFCILTTGLASKLPPSTTQQAPPLAPLQPRDDEDEPLNCESVAASDYYGLGVRLGIYFAWLTSYVANISVPDEIASALDTNCIFLLALLVSMLRSTYTKSLKQIDALILLQLSFGSIFGVLSLWGHRTCRFHLEGPAAIRHFGGFGTHSRIILTAVASVFSAWFWLRGVLPDNGSKGLNPVHEDGCEMLYTFLFAKVPAQGGIRIFFAVISVANTVYFGAILFVSSVAFIARIKRMLQLARTEQWAETSRLKYRTGFTYKELRRIFKMLRILNIIWLVLTAISVEFTLNFNHVHGVLGDAGRIYIPSQLLPMLIGVLSFVRILWIRFENWRSPDDIEPSLPPTSNARPRRARTFRSPSDVLKLFSPALSRTFMETDQLSKETNASYATVVGPRWKRYVVGWLPWLSLVSWFCKDDDNPELKSEAQRKAGESYDA